MSVIGTIHYSIVFIPIIMDITKGAVIQATESCNLSRCNSRCKTVARISTRETTKIVLRDFLVEVEALSNLCNKGNLLRAGWY